LLNKENSQTVIHRRFSNIEYIEIDEYKRIRAISEWQCVAVVNLESRAALGSLTRCANCVGKVEIVFF